MCGVAAAERITGPYLKFAADPAFDAHGDFGWTHPRGITVLPFGEGHGHIDWSPDGLRFIAGAGGAQVHAAPATASARSVTPPPTARPESVRPVGCSI